MSLTSVRSWWVGHRGFSLRPKLSVHSFIHS